MRAFPAVLRPDPAGVGVWTCGEVTHPLSKEAPMTAEPRPCARCGAEIPAVRIEAIPETMVCVRCAGEMGGSEFQVVVIPERISKEGSLKKNYGGYSTRKIRKPIRPKEEGEG
jgi:hypothetical protein